tara:strand:+ start:1110 stop:1334 length:225 start_codon:yes stop_codon:yes gene_type:complete
MTIKDDDSFDFVDSIKTEALTDLDFNEYLVQSKLEPELFKKFYKYLQKNKLNRSSGIKKILNIFFSNSETKNND